MAVKPKLWAGLGISERPESSSWHEPAGGSSRLTNKATFWRGIPEIPDTSCCVVLSLGGILVAEAEWSRKGSGRSISAKAQNFPGVFHLKRKQQDQRPDTVPFYPRETPAKGTQSFCSAGDVLEQGETNVTQQASPCGKCIRGQLLPHQEQCSGKLKFSDGEKKNQFQSRMQLV